MDYSQFSFDEHWLSAIIDPMAIAIVIGIGADRLNLILSGAVRPTVKERDCLTTLFAEYRDAVMQINVQALAVRIQESC